MKSSLLTEQCIPYTEPKFRLFLCVASFNSSRLPLSTGRVFGSYHQRVDAVIVCVRSRMAGRMENANNSNVFQRKAERNESSQWTPGSVVDAHGRVRFR